MNLLKSREAVDVDASLETAVEGEIREFVRRDFASARRQPENEGEAVANNISSLLQRGDAIDQDHRGKPDQLEEGAGRAQHPRIAIRTVH